MHVRKHLQTGPAVLGAAGLLVGVIAAAQETTVEHSRTDHSTKIEAHLEKKFTVRLDAKPHENFRCKVNVTLDYLQKNDIVQVEAIITNQDCAASSGRYTVAIRVLDADNNSVEHEFQETWQRVDDQQIVTTTSYPIGKNVDLRRVRAKNLSCTCVEPIIQESNEP